MNGDAEERKTEEPIMNGDVEECKTEEIKTEEPVAAQQYEDQEGGA
jgi:hypothetical protein